MSRHAFRLWLICCAPNHPGSLIFTQATPNPPISPLFPYTTLFRSLGRSGPRDGGLRLTGHRRAQDRSDARRRRGPRAVRSEEHTSELQSLRQLVCRLLLEKKNLPLSQYSTAQRTPIPETQKITTRD